MVQFCHISSGGEEIATQEAKLVKEVNFLLKKMHEAYGLIFNSLHLTPRDAKHSSVPPQRSEAAKCSSKSPGHTSVDNCHSHLYHTKF